MDDLVIRRFEIDDLDETAAVWKVLALEAGGEREGMFHTGEENVARWKNFALNHHKQNHNRILVAEFNGRIIGLLLFNEKDEHWLQPKHPWAFIYELVVLPQFRGRGVASRLMQHCLQYLKSIGVDRVHLRVSAVNKPALSFYRKHNFNDFELVLESRLS